MSNDVSANGLLGIRVEHCAGSAIDLCDDLVCDHDSNAKLVGEPLKRAHKLGQVRLSAAQLATAHEIRSIQRSSTVDDKKRKSGFGHHLSSLVEQLELVVGVVCSGVCNVV